MTAAANRQAAYGAAERRGFTLVELVVVIAIIIILVAAVALIGSRVLHSHKVEVTKQTMRNVVAAIEQFKEQNPLRLIYDQETPTTAPPRSRAFGPYPPYMLAAWSAAGPPTVANVLESGAEYHRVGPPNTQYVLADRLHRDFGGRAGNVTDFAQLDPDNSLRRHDDIRALYTCLKVYAPGTLGQVPAEALRPLNPNFQEFTNPTGKGTTPNTQPPGLIDVLGIHDAWGVPLDYFLAVKLEYKILPGSNTAGWYVADRMPMLRSLGITRDEYQTHLQAGTRPAPDTWVFSGEFPAPKADVHKTNGTFNTLNSRGAGWARAIGDRDLNEDFGFVP